MWKYHICCLLACAFVIGCTPKSRYKVEFQYVSPTHLDDARKLKGTVYGRGWSADTNTIEFKRVFDDLYDKLVVWRSGHEK